MCEPNNPQQWFEHRAAAIHAIRRSDDYTSVLSKVCSGHLSVTCAPIEPDPSDSTLSKRAWERAVQTYRIRLAQLAWHATSDGIRRAARDVVANHIDGHVDTAHLRQPTLRFEYNGTNHGEFRACGTCRWSYGYCPWSVACDYDAVACAVN